MVIALQAPGCQPEVELPGKGMEANGRASGCDMWKAGCEREYCEKLAKATDGAVRAGWIPQVVKGDVCEKQLNHTAGGEHWGHSGK